MRLVGGAMTNRPRGPEGSGEASDPPPAAEVECGSIKGPWACSSIAPYGDGRGAEIVHF
jgi:hypothetical protein